MIYKIASSFNKSKREIEETNCKDYFWHLISNIIPMLKATTAWKNIYPILILKITAFGKQSLYKNKTRLQMYILQ